MQRRTPRLSTPNAYAQPLVALDPALWSQVAGGSGPVTSAAASVGTGGLAALPGQASTGIPGGPNGGWKISLGGPNGGW